MAIELNDYYKKFNYHKKRIKKSNLTNQLMNNLSLDIMGQKYLMDYFNCNVLIFNKKINKYHFNIQYDPYKLNIVIMMWNNNTYYPINQNFDIKQNIKDIENKLSIKIDVNEHFNPFKKNMKSVSSYKLSQLQDIAKSYNLEIIKIHNGKSKKKTKKELYEEIKQTMY